MNFRKYIFLLLVLIAIPVVCSVSFVIITSLRAAPVVADVAVVLGNKVKSDGQPAAGLTARLNEALKLYNARQVQRIVVSGGIEANGMSEAVVMANYLEERGVPANVIMKDPTGQTTHLTAVALSHMLPHDTSVIAVSQWFHLARSELALRQCGFYKVSGAAPRVFRIKDFYSLGREAVGLPYYWLFHTTCRKAD